MSRTKLSPVEEVQIALIDEYYRVRGWDAHMGTHELNKILELTKSTIPVLAKYLLLPARTFRNMANSGMIPPGVALSLRMLAQTRLGASSNPAPL
jgi:hypothetical protein